jgi:hypothetical protein
MVSKSGRCFTVSRRRAIKLGLLTALFGPGSTLALDAVPSSVQSVDCLTVLCDLVIPDSGTPGALAAGVPKFLATALRSGLLGADPDVDYGLWALDYLGHDFLDIDSDAQLVRLTQLDDQAFDRRLSTPAIQPWVVLKRLIIWAYYTSEVGGSVALRYVHQPGRWDADLPKDEQPRALSNDWTAVEFG